MTVFYRLPAVRLVLAGVVLAVLFSFRLYYGHDILLSGDEVGVGVVQAAGKWDLLRDSLQVGQVVPMEQLRSYVTYSPDFSTGDVVGIMWKDKLHPPLYFILLHYILAIFGNTPLVLRAFSVFLSVVSVLIAYLLGKEIKDRQTGFVFALFMILSPYCLEYSVMVRLYPLAMLLALLSSYFLIRMVRQQSHSFSSPVTYAYIIVSLAGMYTYYSFSVILLSHFVFLAMYSERRFRNFLSIIAMYLIILVLVIPWIIPFLEGLGQVGTKDFYFKGSYTLPELFVYFFRTLFFPFNYPPFLEKYPILDPIILILTIGLGIIILTGIYLSRQNRILKGLLISVVFYIAVSVINDKIFGTSTFIFDRQHYYTIPVLLLVCAGSVTGFSGKRYLFSSVLVLFITIFIVGSAYRFKNKSMFDGPYFFSVLNQQLEAKCRQKDDKSCLVMMNMKEKRYVLPFVYSSERNFNMILMPEGLNDILIRSVLTKSGYHDIFVVNMDLPERKRKRLKLISFGQKELDSTLLLSGYSRSGEPFVFNYEEHMTLYHFKRTSLEQYRSDSKHN